MGTDPNTHTQKVQDMKSWLTLYANYIKIFLSPVALHTLQSQRAAHIHPDIHMQEIHWYRHKFDHTHLKQDSSPHHELKREYLSGKVKSFMTLLKVIHVLYVLKTTGIYSKS